METSFIIEPCTRQVVRFGDCDPFGHLNNARYLDYLVSAWEDHLSQFYGFTLQEFLQRGFGWVVGHHEIAYLKPARYYEPIRIQTSLISLSDSFLQVEALMLNEEMQHVKTVLWTKYYYVSTVTGQKAVHPPELLDFFGKLQNYKVEPAAGLLARAAQLRTKPVTT